MANFSKGYLGGAMEEKPQPKQEMGGGEEGEGEGPDAKIESHLKEMHAATGHGHSHIQHKPEGHIAHHISHEGQMSGPEETQDCPGGMCGGGGGM
jgi:hypothetical protein